LDLVNNLERREYRCFSNLVRPHHTNIQGLEEAIQSALNCNYKLLIFGCEAVVVGGGEFREEQTE
jgi:hypothetical protein